jgi:hypothetical protein
MHPAFISVVSSKDDWDQLAPASGRSAAARLFNGALTVKAMTDLNLVWGGRLRGA